jgi:CRISPR-associated protein Csd2
VTPPSLAHVDCPSTSTRSIDKIVPLDLSITRVAVTRAEDTEVAVSEDGGEGQGGKRTEMGRKSMVPCGFYRAHGFFNPHFAKQTGADREDLQLFWSALQNMFDLDRSSARGMMAVQGFTCSATKARLATLPPNACSSG